MPTGTEQIIPENLLHFLIVSFLESVDKPDRAIVLRRHGFSHFSYGYFIWGKYSILGQRLPMVVAVAEKDHCATTLLHKNLRYQDIIWIKELLKLMII